MWPTLITLWLAPSGQVPLRPAPRRRPAFRRLASRPRLEALEDRCLLSAGALDPTFGNGAGYVTTSTSTYNDFAHSALIQPNGEIVAVGSAGTSTGSELAVERYNPDGSLDTAFGSGGVALASFGSGYARGPGAALYPQAGTANDGKIVQVGSYNGQYQILARYNTNGTLDSTFGTGGEVTTTFPGGAGYYNGTVVVTSAGQIVTCIDDNVGTFALARYNSDGSLDTTFGQGGYAITTVPGGQETQGGSTLLQQPDGTLVVATSRTAGTWYLVGFNANGTLNTSFGNQGLVATSAPGGPDDAVLYFNAGPTNDGQIVVMGGTDNGMKELARYNANGSLDTTFGTGGLMQTPFSLLPYQITLDANSRIVAAGAPPGGFSASSTTELARFNLNGTPDTTFGNGGLVTTTFGTASEGLGVAIYPNAGTATDGDIVVVGSSNTGTKDNALVARYLGDSPSFAVTGFPSPSTAGVAGTFTVTARDASGNVLTGYAGTVHFTSSDPRAVLPAGYTFTAADQGIHTFSATLKTAGSQSITAADTTTSTMIGSEAGIVIQPAAASQFLLSAPSSVTHGRAFSLTLTVEDAYGNVVTGYVGTVHFTSSDGMATLAANYTFTAADAGVHTFVNKTILRQRGQQTITVTDTLNSALTATDSISVV